ncbi:hypothetical protein [Alishewanella longhuensis]
MLSITNEDKENQLKSYCQHWLNLLATNQFEGAAKLIDIKNNYGVVWAESELKDIVQDYFGSNAPVSFQNEDIANCYPEYLETDSGSLIFGFYLPANGEITDLTVEFEFVPTGNNKYAATINDVHVL